jgi:hypothetical protein
MHDGEPTKRGSTRTESKEEDRTMSHRSHPKRTAALLLLSALVMGGCGSDETSAPLSENPLDETPPLTPSGIALGAQMSTKFQLNWQANSEPDFAGYRVYLYSPDPGRAESYVCLTSSHPLAQPRLIYGGENGTTYYFRISAVDASDNESAWSEPFAFTFAAGVTDLPNEVVGGDDFPDFPGHAIDKPDLPSNGGQISTGR